VTRRQVFGAALTFLAAPFVARADSPDPPWLATLMARLAQIPERHATFDESHDFGALNAPLISHGTLLYRRPDHLEKITAQPRLEKLVVDGDTLTITPPDGFPRTISLDNQPEAAVFVDALRAPLSGDLSLLRRHYAVSAGGTLEDWRLDLTPIDPKARDLLRGLAIAGSDTTINTIMITLANGDTQRMTMRDAP
jgi:outer membrane lipoprotein-sorting protein